MKHNVGEAYIYDGYSNDKMYLTIRDVTMEIKEKDLIDLMKTGFKTKAGRELLTEILKKYDEKPRV